MKTKKISLFYQLTDKEIFPPPAASVARKDAWIKELQRSMPNPGEHRTVKVTYEMFNPEVEAVRKFFNGPVVDYYAIQSCEVYEGDVPREMHNRVRETLLSDVLGYEVRLLDRTERRRKSTADFIDTQQWTDFLEGMRETVFEPNGYEMPNSEVFWELAKKHDVAEARAVCIRQLQTKLKHRLST